MFLVSLVWEASVESALETGMTFHLSCPKFAINFPKFWWEQAPTGKHRRRCQAVLVLQPATAPSTLICFAKPIHKWLMCKKNPKPFRVIWQAATQGLRLSWFINLEWLWIDHIEVQGFVSCCQSLGLQSIPKHILVLRTKHFTDTHR